MARRRFLTSKVFAAIPRTAYRSFLSQHPNSFREDDLMAYNAVGEIPGTDKRGEVLMLGGHLDSWHMGTGATDDDTGSIVMLEAVRILKAIGASAQHSAGGGRNNVVNRSSV